MSLQGDVDEMMGEWLRQHPNYTPLEYDHAVHAATAYCRRISIQKGNQTMCETKTQTPPPVDSKETLQVRADKLADSIPAVRKRTLEVAGTHGADRVRGILKTFSVDNISNLPLHQVNSYCYKLETLALELPPAEVAFIKASAGAPNISVFPSITDALSARDRHMFEAGREYQRKY